MKDKLRSIVNINRELVSYTFLNYLDKFIGFCLPLAVLYISKDRKAYNDIEYIFSIANIAVVVLELGLRTYYFYGFSISKSRDVYVQQVKGYFGLLFLLYGLLAFFFAPLVIFVSPAFSTVFIFIVIRAMFLLFTGFSGNYYRLIDKPSFIFWYTIPVNLFSFIAIVLISVLGIGETLSAFFVSQGILIILVIALSKKYSFRQIGELFRYLKTALNYSWPLIVNVLLISYINNYAKIHAYNNMSTDDMFQLSFILRISLIIQMMHTSIGGFYSKQIFIDSYFGINKKIFLLYLGLLSFAVFMVITFIIILNLIPGVLKIEVNIANVCIMLYTLLWCLQAFLELYLSKFNKPKVILLFASISTAIYISLMFGTNVKTINDLAYVMLVAIAINISMTIGYLKFKLFRTRAN